MDGSARPFVFLINQRVSKNRIIQKIHKNKKDIEVKQNDKWAKNRTL